MGCIVFSRTNCSAAGSWPRPSCLQGRSPALDGRRLHHTELLHHVSIVEVLRWLVADCIMPNSRIMSPRPKPCAEFPRHLAKVVSRTGDTTNVVERANAPPHAQLLHHVAKADARALYSKKTYPGTSTAARDSVAGEPAPKSLVQ